LDPLGVSLETGGWLEYEVTVNDAYTGQTYQDIAELVSDVLSTSARYELQALLKFSVSADATGMRIGLHGGGSGSAATALAGVLATSTNPTNAATFIIKDPDASANTILASASVIGIVLVWGFVTTRSGGSPTISIQHLKVTSGTVTCLPGSKMRLRKCGA
jgi:hypothetical protein